MGDKGNKKDKNQNIQVFARLRPINQREREIKSMGVIEVSGPKEVVVKYSLQSNITKKFYFDKAFGPQSKQVEVYQEVVSPLIEEVLSGYNCTVFAYGQTGTGKTHTMVGENSSNEFSWQNDPMAGIIPRALSQLFDELRLINTEYAVRISYLELYNEELFDLLANSDDNSKLRIYEDATKKGVNIVSGLEEVAVYSKSEVFKIMEKGQERRKMAATLMNAQSSRSHTVFTIVVHMKENSSEGEELIKVGKLNLVDLAGSENISKAGSDNPSKKERARECVNINQSLLTLGRVITALVERHPHIPYRESKLTRLLQESLGGRTKTSIIATISPGHKDLEETLSTLEYAYRAKNIQNKPEVNQKMTKRAVLKEYTDEIERLKRELHATREKNGVYLDNKTYSDILSKQQDQEKDLLDKIVAIRVVQEEKLKLEEGYRQLEEQFKDKSQRLEETSQHLSSTKNELNDAKTQLIKTQNVVEEQQCLVAKRVETEEKLSSQAKALLTAADKATDHVECLQNTVAKRSTLAQNNHDATMRFTTACSENRAEMKSYLDGATEDMRHRMVVVQSEMGDQHSEYIRHQSDHKTQIDSIIEQIKSAIIKMEEGRRKNERKVVEFTEESKDGIRRNVEDHRVKVEGSLGKFLEQLTGVVEGARSKERKMLDDMFGYMDGVCSAYKLELCGLRDAQLSWNSTMEQRLRAMRDKNSEDVRRHLEEKADLLTLYEGDRREFEELVAVLEHELMDLKAQQGSLTEKMLERIREEDVQLMSSADAFNQLADNGMSRLFQIGEDVASRTSKLLGNQECLVEAVQDRVEKSHVSTFSCLRDVECDVQKDVSSTIEESKASSAEFVKTTEGTLDAMLSSHIQLTNKTMAGIHKLTSTSEQCLEQLSRNTLNATEQQSERHHTLVQSLTGSTASVQEFRGTLDREISRHDDLHNRFVDSEYGVYSPTGKTPMKQEYKYPKMLVSTSPHERIIKRFRALRGYKDEDSNELTEVIEIKDDSDSPDLSSVSVAYAETSVCSLASDGEGVFLEPRRPPSARSTPNSVYRTMSENDLVKGSAGKKIGKENLRISAEKSITKAKKRRPQSQTRPLVTRN